MHRSDSERSGGRPYSTNNPFRTASVDAELNQHRSDQDFQDWVSSNTVYMPSSARNNRSTLSFTDSIGEDTQRYASPTHSTHRDSYRYVLRCFEYLTRERNLLPGPYIASLAKHVDLLRG